MICDPCRHRDHGHCVDNPRRAHAHLKEIPGVKPGTSMWCYCAHQTEGLHVNWPAVIGSTHAHQMTQPEQPVDC